MVVMRLPKNFQISVVFSELHKFPAFRRQQVLEVFCLPAAAAPRALHSNYMILCRGDLKVLTVVFFPNSFLSKRLEL